jgi:hypothetical protein
MKAVTTAVKPAVRKITAVALVIVIVSYALLRLGGMACTFSVKKRIHCCLHHRSTAEIEINCALCCYFTSVLGHPSQMSLTVTNI